MDNSCGYNLREASNKGKLSEETKKKISGSKKGKTLGIDNHFYGKYHTDETKKKISTSRMGKNVGHVGYMTGKHHTDDFKKNVSEKMKNNEHALGFQQFNVNL